MADPFNFLPMDPNALRQQAMDQDTRDVEAVGGSAATRANSLGMRQSITQAFGNPQINHAQVLQQRIGSALADSDQGANDSENPLDAQERRLHAVYHAVADIDPQTALRVAGQLIQVKNEKQEQSRLLAAGQEQAQKSAIERQTQGTLVVGSPDRDKVYGRVSLFNPDGSVNPDAQTQLQKLQSDNPDALTTTQEKFASDKIQAAQIRAAAQEQVAATRAAQKDADKLQQDDPTTAFYAQQLALQGTASLSRLGAEDRKAAVKYLADRGLTAFDTNEAQMQVAGLKQAIKTGATRAGQVDFLQNEIPGQAKNALDALDKVDRSRVNAVNQLLVRGKTEFSDPNESAYAVAIQGLVTPYARLIAGATGVTSDKAREEAYDLITKYQGADAVKAAIHQIVDKELQTASQAGDATIEMARNSRRYSAINKIAEKLGIPTSQFLAQQGDDSGTSAAPATAPKAVNWSDLK